MIFGYEAQKIFLEVNGMRFNSLNPELTVKDINVTKRSYLELLGFKLEYEKKKINLFLYYLKVCK